MSYVAAFRTHIWDDDIAKFAERFFAACPTARQVVLVDETRGPLDIPYDKVSHTDRTFEALGLPAHPPGQVLWYSGDYGLYFLQRALPDYDFYVLSEYDISVNMSLEPMMAAAAARQLDVILHQVQPSTPDWVWYENGKASFAEPWRCLMFFMVASQRAVQALFDARRSMGRRFAAAALTDWPFCETFVPSVLKAAGMSFEEVGAFADVSSLRFRPRMSWRDPQTGRPGSIAHPVLGSRRFIPAIISDNPPMDYFIEGSELRSGLDHEPFGDVVEPLAQAFLRKRDRLGLARLREEMEARGLSPPPIAAGDLALNKPALSSSTSSWSDVDDPARDAEGANAAWLPAEYGFHTDEQTSPWWMVDLLGEHVVDRVDILNRARLAERFVKFRVDSSLDGSAWVTRYAKIDSQPVSSEPNAPWSTTFADPFVARYVRIYALECSLLHLRRVQVFGRAISAPLRATP